MIIIVAVWWLHRRNLVKFAHDPKQSAAHITRYSPHRLQAACDRSVHPPANALRLLSRDLR
jgi:hypothetical protein